MEWIGMNIATLANRAMFTTLNGGNGRSNDAVRKASFMIE